MIDAMQFRVATLLLLLPFGHSPALAQCAPAPDSPYFFRNLAEQRAEAKLTEDRAFYEKLLGAGFVAKGADGKSLPKREFIDLELASHPAASSFYAVRDFRLDEHRKGMTVASYRLVEGNTGKNSQVTETWKREVYEVVEGAWYLVSVENVEPRAAEPQK